MRKILTEKEAAEILSKIARGEVEEIGDDDDKQFVKPSPKEQLDAIKLLRNEGWIIEES